MPKFLSQKLGAQRLGSVDFTTGQMQAGEDVFTVMGATDITDAVTFALSKIGANPLDPEGSIAATRLGAPCLGINQVQEDEGGNFDVYMNYRQPDFSGSGGDVDTLEFNTSGGTARIFNSVSTLSRLAPAGKTAPDHKGAINVTDTSVEGADIDVARFDFSQTRIYRAGELTDAMIAQYRFLTNKINVGPMFGAEDSEIKFNGASGTRTTAGGRVSFSFSYSPNARNFWVGPPTTGIFVPIKHGWDLLWVRHERQPDTNAHLAVLQPMGVYIEQVYVLADLSPLGFT